MKKKWLSKDEKIVIQSFIGSVSDIKIFSNEMEGVINELKEKNMVNACSDKSGKMCVWLTPTGKFYIEKNPTLKNPISEKTKWIIGLLIPALTGIATALIS